MTAEIRGADGKIVNDLLRADDKGALPAPPPKTETIGFVPAGDSSEQRRAEAVMLGLLGEHLGLTLQPRRIPIGDSGVRVEIDGADENLTTLVEAWAHHGPPKAAQRNKVLADAFKLIHVARTLPATPRLILCLCDMEAARPFTTARSWAANALRAFHVDVVVVKLPEDVSTAVLAAQRRQVR